jgi:thioredoxin 1
VSIIHIDEAAFEKLATQDKIVLVDFWASWCGPCQLITPVIEEIAQEKSDIIVAKVDVDSNPNLAVKFGIDAIPAILTFKNGVVQNRAVGLMDKAALLKKLGL